MRYEFHPEAEVDLVETIPYYETQAPGLGGRFAAEVELRYPDTDDLVYIPVVESQHRRPGYWKSRLTGGGDE